MVNTPTIFRAAFMTAAALALAACGSSSDKSGNVTFYITDAPVDQASAVVLAMTYLELKPAEGPAFRVDFDPELAGEDGVVELNILDYTKGNAAKLVSSEEVPAGNYEWLRIFFDESRSYIQLEDGGEQYSFFMPSGAQTGYKAIGGFTVPVNQDAAYILDFDVRKSVLEPPGLGRLGESRRFLLKPTVRLMNLEDTGGVRGTVAFDLLADAEANAETCAGGDAVYVFEDVGVDPFGEGVTPLVSDIVDIVTLEDGSTAGEYALMFLLPRDYTLAFTCSASLDMQDGEEYTWPPTDEDFSAEDFFSATATVEILSGEVVECDFDTAGENDC